MNSSWDRLRILCYLSGILGGLALIFVLYVLWLKNRATQTNYFAVYLFILLTIAVLLGYSFYMMWDLNSSYSGVRAQFLGLKGCILDNNWKRVPTGLYTNTNMESFHNWMIAWTALLGAALFFGLILLCYVMSQLGKERRRS